MTREVILSEGQIKEVCVDLAAKLDKRFEDEGVELPVFIGVLKGALNFYMDLIKELRTNIITDFIQVSSYKGTSSTGAVILKKDVTEKINGKTIIIVEDVIDTGLTMKYLVNYLASKYTPKEIIVVSLFDKTFLRKTDLKVDYCGKTLVENKFLLGYGLDYREIKRNVPYVYAATEQEIKAIDELIKRNEN